MTIQNEVDYQLGMSRLEALDSTNPEIWRKWRRWATRWRPTKTATDTRHYGPVWPAPESN